MVHISRTRGGEQVIVGPLEGHLHRWSLGANMGAHDGVLVLVVEEGGALGSLEGLPLAFFPSIVTVVMVGSGVDPEEEYDLGVCNPVATQLQQTFEKV